MRKLEEELGQLWFLNMEILEEKAYFSAGWFNGLVEADIKTGEAKVIAKFPHEKELVGDLHAETLYVNDKLYFCPRSTNWLYIYDINKKEMKAIDLPENEKYWEERETKFGKIVLRGKYLYLLPVNYNQVLCFDIESEEFTVYDDWFSDLKELINYEEEMIKYKAFLYPPMIYEDICVWYVRETNYFCVFDVKTGKFKFMEHQCGNIISVEKNDGDPIFICEDGKGWRYCSQESKFIYVDTWDVDVKEIYNVFIKVNDICYFPSILKNELMLYDIKTKEKTYIEFETDGRIYENSIGRRWKRPLLLVKYINDDIYMLNHYNELFIFNVKSMSYSTKRFVLDTCVSINWDWKLGRGVYSNKYTYFPHDSSNPEVLLNIMNNLENEKSVKEHGNYGEMIFQNIKSNLEDSIDL